MAQLGVEDELIDSLQMQFGRLDIYDGYMVTTTFEGYEVAVSDYDLTVDVAKKYYGDRQWGLIANRVNKYTLDVVSLGQTFKNSNIMGLALIIGSQAAIAQRTWLPEQLYCYTFPVRAFSTMERAVGWVQQQVGSAV